MTQLHKYWIRMRISISDDAPPGILLGIGVTAYSRDDAIGIVREKVFHCGAMPEILQFTEDVPMSSLDSSHVLPNIGNHLVEGVWFPLGYA